MQSTELHPRPQLTRERWIDLCGTWAFAYDDGNIGILQRWYDSAEVFDRQIQVPFPPESKASGIGDPTFHPYVWYRRTFEYSAQGERLLLHFGAVDYSADVWVNGQHVVHHEGGHTPFTADITNALNPQNAEQVVVVRAEDQPRDTTQPRGKQYWQEKSKEIWYTRTTGIWQPVWLEPVPQTYIKSIRWTPDTDKNQLGMHVRLNENPDRDLFLRVRLVLNDLVLSDDTYTVQRLDVRRDIGLEAVRGVDGRKVIWTPRYPNLIDAELTLTDGTQVIDEVYSYAGLRSCGFNNGRFVLNGSPTYLRLVLEQGYYPDTLLAAPDSDTLRREVELIKSLGFNGVRIHQKVEDPRFLYWCDKLGLMVWGEMANAFSFTTKSVERLMSEWMEVLERDYNHPCIVTWVPLNESWGVPNLERDPAQRHFVRTMYHMTKALDPTRPVIGNDGWEHIITDIVGIHDYAINGDSLRERYLSMDSIETTLRQVQPGFRTVLLPEATWKGEPIMLTECGGIAYTPNPGEPWFGYGTVSNAEEFLQRYDELISAILDSPIISGFCYTQLTDVEQETNGLLTIDRTPKLAPEDVYKITRKPSRALPGEVLAQVQQAAEAISNRTPTPPYATSTIKS